MKFVVLFCLVAALYVVSAESDLDNKIEAAFKTIENVVKRSARDTANVEKREGGIHVNGECSGLGEKCHMFQHCCGDLDCNGAFFGGFGSTCQNK